MFGNETTSAIFAALPGREDETPSPIEPLAQAMELIDRYNRLQVRHQFQAGQLARQKPGIGHITPKARNVFIVIRPLTDSVYDRLLLQDYVRQSPLWYAAHEPDLIVADNSRTYGKTMALELMSSTVLQPVTMDELAAWPLPPAED